MAKPKVTVEPFVAPSEPQAQPEETVTIDLGNGITRTLARGKGSNRVSDAVWAEAQRQARKELADKQKESSVEGLVERTDKVKKSADAAVDDAKLPGDDVDQLVARTDKVKKSADQAVDDAQLPATPKKTRYEVTPGEITMEDVDPNSVDGLIERTNKVNQSADEAVDSVKAPPTPSAKGKYEVKPGEVEFASEGVVSSPKGTWGTASLDPRAMGGSVAKMALGAAPSEPPHSTGVVLNGNIFKSPEEEAIVNKMSPETRTKFINERVRHMQYRQNHPPSQSELGDIGEQTPQPTFFDKAAHLAGQLPDAIGAAVRNLVPGDAPAGQPQLADPIDDRESGKSLPTDISMGGAGGSVSISTSSKTPGNAKVPVAPKDNYAAQLDANAKLQQDILNKQTEMSRLELKAKADLVRQESTEKSRLALENQQRMNAEMGEMKKHEDGLRDLQQQVLQASRETVDPDRYWNSRDTGQKIAGVLAGALFGFTGQGMQWLQRVDSLVAQDMQAQASDLARKRGYLQDATGLQNNIIAQAEAKGLKGDAAYKAAVITMKENIADQIMLNAMNYADPQLRLSAEKQAADLRMSTEKEKMEYGNLMKTRALDAGLKVAQMNHLNAQTEAARIAASTKASGGEGLDKVDAVAATEIAKARSALEAVKKTRELLGKKGAFGTTADQYSKNIGDFMRTVGMGDLASLAFPDTTDRISALEQLQEIIYKGATGEAIMKDDRPLIKERSAMPGFTSDKTGWLDSMEEQALARIKAYTDTQKEAGRDTRGMTVPNPAVRSFTPKGK